MACILSFIKTGATVVGTMGAIVLMPLLSTRSGAQDVRLMFDSAAVRPHPNSRGKEQLRITPTSVTVRGASMGWLIRWAYDVRMDQVWGPAWLRTEAYDVDSKMDRPSTQRQAEVMMRSLLADRFKLQFHRETKPTSVYWLVGDSKGTKPSPASDNEPSTIDLSQQDSGKVAFRHASMAELASWLVEFGAADHPVVDHTGLQGAFDFVIRCAPGCRLSMFEEVNPSRATFTPASLGELGLKLQLRNEPTEVLIVDHIEKTPTDN